MENGTSMNHVFHEEGFFPSLSKSSSKCVTVQDCHINICMGAKLLLSHLTLCNAMDYSLPGFSAHGNLQGKNTGMGCSVQGIFPT